MEPLVAGFKLPADFELDAIDELVFELLAGADKLTLELDWPIEVGFELA